MIRLISLLMLTFSVLYSNFAVAEDEEKIKSAYFALKPSLIANVQGKARYARCDIQIMVDEDTLPDIQLHASAIRHELLLLLGDQKGESLQDPKGKERFRQTALSAVGKVVKTLTGKNSVKDLFFTSFFVQ